MEGGEWELCSGGRLQERRVNVEEEKARGGSLAVSVGEKWEQEALPAFLKRK